MLALLVSSSCFMSWTFTFGFSFARYVLQGYLLLPGTALSFIFKSSLIATSFGVYTLQVMVAIFEDVNTTFSYGLVVKQLDRFFAGVLLRPQEISKGLKWSKSTVLPAF